MATIPRILEVGDYDHFKRTYPEQTTLLWTGWRRPGAVRRDAYDDCTPRRFQAAMRAVAAGDYDIVVAYLTPRSRWHPRYWLRAFLREPWRPFSTLTRVFGVSWLRLFKLRVPLIVLDINNSFRIGRHGFFLLDKADLVFKRELPVDRWHVLFGSAHPNLPTQRIRRSAKWQARLAKLRPLALPINVIDPKLFENGFPEKTVDLFFAGAIDSNNWVRRAGFPELKALAGRGISVDVPEGRLELDEFYRRLAGARLAWSPAGYSWECFRTGEAAQCLTVPIVVNPTIERDRPLLDGLHLFHYDAEPGGLTRVVEKALADGERLRQMAVVARAHVLEHHTLKGIVDHVLETAYWSIKR